jgi:hypothetical protein
MRSLSDSLTKNRIIITFTTLPFNSGNIHEADAATIVLTRKMLQREAKKDLSLWDIVTNARSLMKIKTRKIESSNNF